MVCTTLGGNRPLMVGLLKSAAAENDILHMQRSDVERARSSRPAAPPRPQPLCVATLGRPCATAMAKATLPVLKRPTASRKSSWSVLRAKAPGASRATLCVLECQQPPTTSRAMGSWQGSIMTPFWLGVSPPSTTRNGVAPPSATGSWAVELCSFSQLDSHGKKRLLGIGHSTTERHPDRGCGVRGTETIACKISGHEGTPALSLPAGATWRWGPMSGSNSVSLRKSSSAIPDTPPVTTSRAEGSRVLRATHKGPPCGRPRIAMANEVRPVRRLTRDPSSSPMASLAEVCVAFALGARWRA
mmetsp:Transcript_90194/g.254441  ORF Transcript_90194/g.254441 Transcript_90194/m.254441 type:complete len:301 (-) Transcript_90194:733-1635(-)